MSYEILFFDVVIIQRVLETCAGGKNKFSFITSFWIQGNLNKYCLKIALTLIKLLGNAF